jgi:hypothetical protein
VLGDMRKKYSQLERGRSRSCSLRLLKTHVVVPKGLDRSKQVNTSEVEQNNT